MRDQIMIVEPAVRYPNLDCFNNLALLSPLPLTYHLPALYGFESLRSTDLAGVRGVVVMGSAASVNDRPPWQDRLQQWIGECWSRRLPTLGICYGHQLFGRMLGARVDYVFEDGAKANGFRRLRLSDPPPWASGVGDSVRLCVSHRQAVLECPPDARVFASSEAVAVDGFAHRELPVFGLQPHPEATAVFLSQHEIAVEGPVEQWLVDGHRLLRAYLEFCAGQG